MNYPTQSSRLINAPKWDLRSDTVTKPCAGMRAAIANAEVGDDVYGDDPTVTRLEETVAGLLGKEAGIFLPSGTQSNLIALLTHCGRSEAVIVGNSYHVFVHEAGGASALGGIPYKTFALDNNTMPNPEVIRAAISEDDPHYAPERLLSLENTVSGTVIPLETIRACTDMARQNNLNTHLDGARYFNAITALNCADDALAKHFNTVSVCLSKGLGAPIGSVLVGSADFIHRALYARKMLGGGMRQVGLLAAAGLYALEHVRPNLAEDHRRAAELASALKNMQIGDVQVATNMVFLKPHKDSTQQLQQALAQEHIAITPWDTIRMALHRDITDAGLADIIAAFQRAT